MFRQLEPGFMSRIFKKREAKLGSELAETKLILKEYKKDSELLSIYKRAYVSMADFALEQRDELEACAEKNWDKREKIEAIKEIIKVPDVWSHPDPIKAIREILETSIDNQEKRKTK